MIQQNHDRNSSDKRKYSGTLPKMKIPATEKVNARTSKKEDDEISSEMSKCDSRTRYVS